ncbi:MAG: 50S ribosomal protein L3 [Candidatus Nealsonbacteria bacterium]|nr:50S ribosomal protein L3 [Candidatus Nealsonbacteria bacterium]
MKFILGKKLGMSQLFDKDGKAVPVTLIESGPCYVTQIKTKEKDKYEAVQIGFEKLKDKKVKKSSKKVPFRYIREFSGDISKYKTEDKIDASSFQEGDKVKISGISKGKGFQGPVKRWGFKGRPSTRGTKHEERTHGSVGIGGGMQRVIKGKKMAGHLGHERVTVKNLKIAKVDLENNIIAVKGALPGPRGTILEIRG